MDPKLYRNGRPENTEQASIRGISLVRGVFLTAPYDVQITEFDRPKFPQKAVLARTVMCGVCGIDVHMYKGTVPIVDPIPLGHEWVGRIEEIGQKAEAEDLWGQELRVGDLIIPGFSSQGCGRCIYCKFYMKPYLCVSSKGDPFEKTKARGIVRPTVFDVGGYCDYRYVFPNGWVYKVPGDLPPEVAVLTEHFSTALHVGDYAGKEGLTVVVQGSGPIGLLSVMAVKLSGAATTIVVGAPEGRLRLCKEFGAGYAISIQEVPEAEDRIRSVKKLTRAGAGADVVVEAAGTPEAFTEGPAPRVVAS